MRIYVALNPEEHAALSAMAQQDLRDAKDQIKYLIRAEARRRGLLPAVTTPSEDCPAEPAALPSPPEAPEAPERPELSPEALRVLGQIVRLVLQECPPPPKPEFMPLPEKREEENK